jgi:aryl-alcohol dehydrogenase-like predicted oxidoreductase
LLREVERLAQEKHVTPSQLALAWILAQGDDVVPIPGTKRVTYLEENAAAANVTLSRQELERLESTFPVGVTAGDRYKNMATVHR